MLSVCLLALFLLPLFMSTLKTQTPRLHLLAPLLFAFCFLAFMPATHAQDDLLSDDIPALSSEDIPALSSDKSSDLTPNLNDERAPEHKQELHPSIDSVLKPLIPENALTPTDDAEVKGKLALEDLRSFVTAFNHIRNAYVEEVDDKTLLQNAIKGMLTELDPHSNYLEPESYEDLQCDENPQYAPSCPSYRQEDSFAYFNEE